MTVLPAALIEIIDRVPEPGQWYPIHSLVTSATAEPAVCLLSSFELRATESTVSAVSRSSRAAANLAVRPWATMVAWANALHYITLEVRETIRRDGVHGYLFDVRGVRVDDIGITMRPLEYRMEDWLAAAERWDVTVSVLDELHQSI